MGWFDGCADGKEVRARFLQLAMRWHPDRPDGDTETMKAINADYERANRGIFDRDVQAKTRTQGSADYQMNWSELMRDLIERTVALGLDVEIRGAWLWLTEGFEGHEDELVKMGYRKAKKEATCYYHRCGVPSSNRTKMSHDDIKARHGSKTVTGKRRKSRQEKELDA